jgi:hypothetical protein
MCEINKFAEVAIYELAFGPNHVSFRIQKNLLLNLVTSTLQIRTFILFFRKLQCTF